MRSSFLGDQVNISCTSLKEIKNLVRTLCKEMSSNERF